MDFSDGGFMGYYVGSSSYEILSITETSLVVRTYDAANADLAWYHRFTSEAETGGGEESLVTIYNDLVWADEFDVDGAPNPANWTYDLGAGGWGNGEQQSYTDDPANVKVEEGVLKITAIGSGESGNVVHYYDEVTLIAAGGATSSIEDFEGTAPAFEGFGGASTEVIDNPDATGDNTSTKVAQSTKPVGAEVWAGSFFDMAAPLDLVNSTSISVKTWSPAADAVVRLKIEDQSDNTKFIEIDASTTVSEAWETLTFDLSAAAPAVDPTVSYDRVVLFFDFGVSPTGDAAYTSARIKSENLYEFTYGRVEVRAKLPSSGGTWPALWALGANFAEVGWPDSGEIDIMEHVGNNPNVVSSALHYPGNSGGNAVTSSTSVPTATSEFHNYTVEWTADSIKFVVDDELIHTSFTNTMDTPFNSDFFFIMNIAMGGTLGGAIDDAFTEDTLEPIYISDKEIQFNEQAVEGKLIDFENEQYYKISNNDAMRPFFMSIVSDSNHWMFISSNGGLSAGRKDAGYALFPYYTDDKITESADITGSKTILRIHSEDKTKLWEPFSERYLGIYRITRNLYKNSYGNKVIFEEVNEDLGLTFRYQWNSSDQYGFVKKSTLINNSSKEIDITVLDGIQNIMPYGVDTSLQATSSNLVDAYKKNELEPEVGLGIYALSAIIVDRAEPSEALKAAACLLNDFRKGKSVSQEEDVRAEKGAYFVVADLRLKANSEKQWSIVADVNQTISSIGKITDKIKNDPNLAVVIQEDIELGTRNLIELNAAADGIQLTADKLRNTRHFANSLFNIMRGGIFDDNYQIEKADFIKYIETANKNVLEKKKEVLQELPELFSLVSLRGLANKGEDQNEDKNFKRLCFEYLPLKFSRRHGDPSRPWNKFSINTKNEDGSKILDYQGNWRDIFQNWEALAHSYPEFMENMIHKFLNATTFDGYNPYRVTKDGFDWETIEPHDPWSYIGYWGDHQIIYLLKFLEFIEKHSPNTLAKYFDQDIFVYANVPYKIKSYSDILENPKDTIVLDTVSEEKIIQKRKEIGADGALLEDSNFSIYRVNIIEKLLATVLAKMSNFIPEGGIWMNTQRPEWNDANNALVGNGVSMVTLYYLRRFLNFFEEIVRNAGNETNSVSRELAAVF
ncbi:Beta-glucanase [Nymphon striatum]|nr:Beta-glucanase [Nymphon striatum]